MILALGKRKFSTERYGKMGNNSKDSKVNNGSNVNLKEIVAKLVKQSLEANKKDMTAPKAKEAEASKAKKGTTKTNNNGNNNGDKSGKSSNKPKGWKPADEEEVKKPEDEEDEEAEAESEEEKKKTKHKSSDKKDKPKHDKTKGGGGHDQVRKDSSSSDKQRAAKEKKSDSDFSDTLIKATVMLSGKSSKQLKLSSSNRESITEMFNAFKSLGFDPNTLKDGSLVKKSSQVEEEFPEDRFAWKDFTKSISDQYQVLNKSFETDGGAVGDGAGENRNLIINEVMLDSKFRDLAVTIAGAYQRLYTSIYNSKSTYFTQQDKANAKSLLSEMSLLLGDDTDSTRVRALRYGFIPTIMSLLSSKFPEVANNMIIYSTLVLMQDECRFLRLFASIQKSTTNNYNDNRGLCDVNLHTVLPYLPITDYFKSLLKARGVTDSVLDCLDNYANVGDTTDRDFSEDDFAVIDIHSGSVNTKHYGGPNDLSDIQLRLLSFIDKIKLRALAVISVDSDVYGNIENTFNADLAVKIFIMTSLNAVYKVLVEDGAGTFDRVKESQIRTLENKCGATLYDTAYEILTANFMFYHRPVEKLDKWMATKGFFFDEVVYKFLKENWAPAIKKYEVNNDMYLGDLKLPGDKFIVTIIPKLIVPCNPYDIDVDFIPDTMATGGDLLGVPIQNRIGRLVGEETDRSRLFQCLLLPSAYLDPRNQTSFRDIVIHFSNFFSRSLSYCKSNETFNTYSNDYTTVNNVAMGPFVTSEEADNDFIGELYSSDINRTVKLEFQGGRRFNILHALSGESVCVEDGDNRLSTKASYLPYFHTNSWANRFFLTADYYRTNPSFISANVKRTDSWMRFIDGVVEGDKSYLGTPCVSRSAALLRATGKYMLSLNAKDAFRYSYHRLETSAIAAVDNLTLDKFSTMIEISGVTGDAIASREMTANLVNVGLAGKSIDRAAILNSIQIYENGINPLSGSTLGINGLTDLLSYITIAGSTVKTKLSNRNTLLDERDLIQINKYIVKSFANLKGTSGLMRYRATDIGSTFTKQVLPMTYQCYNGNTSSPNDAAISDFNCWMISDADMARWANILIYWNAANSGLYMYTSSAREFDLIVGRIFAPFTMKGPERVPASSLSRVLYTSSVYASLDVRQGSSFEDDYDRLYIDPVNCCSAGHLFKDELYADKKSTKIMMNALGQKIISNNLSGQYLFSDQDLHKLIIPVNESMLYMNIYHDIYHTKLPDLVEENSFINAEKLS